MGDYLGFSPVWLRCDICLCFLFDCIFPVEALQRSANPQTKQGSQRCFESSGSVLRHKKSVPLHGCIPLAENCTVLCYQRSLGHRTALHHNRLHPDVYSVKERTDTQTAVPKMV